MMRENPISELGKKALGNWMVGMVNKSSFIYSDILETSKDRPNNEPSLTFLEQRVHELAERSIAPLPY